MLESVLDYLKVKEVQFKENVNTSLQSTVRIGGVSRLVVYPKSSEELISTIGIDNLTEISTKIVGRKSNVLFMDGELESILIDTSGVDFIEFKSDKVTVGCGASLPHLASLALARSLSGLEELSGIPGSVGGAVAGCAGAFGREISELVESVTAYDKRTKEVIELLAEDCGFAYRRSIFASGDRIILSVRLRLAEGERESVAVRMAECRERRLSTQPREPSLGSTFKRPSFGYAGEMIEKCGLSGHILGGVQISRKHAGFIINRGGASASDYLELMALIQSSVLSKYSVMLEPEIQIIN